MLAAAIFALLAAVLPVAAMPQNPSSTTDVSARDRIRISAELIGLELTDAEIELMTRTVGARRRAYAQIRAHELDNGIAPAIQFSATGPGIAIRDASIPAHKIELPDVERPADLEQLAFADIPTLASLIKSRKVTCRELTEMFLARLERMDKQLSCVITLTRKRALAQADALDKELEAGKWRGLLHGIPWGAKDLLATRGYRTTWGAKPYEDQVIDLDATVVQRLDAAGAVLIAKLTLGALAMGDVWYGGTTKNPWNPRQGSSGSSAGPAAATAAGCVPFAIGSETLGSIVSPSTRCGNSSLRPTFGRVSRYGAMALSWSMDKLGPLCRSVTDAAIVFDAIRGKDGKDPTAVDEPYTIPWKVDVKGWKVGYLRGVNNERYTKVLAELEKLGVELVPVELPEFDTRPLRIILNAEAAAAFDLLTRSGRDDLLVRQSRNAWPTVFRAARLIPAVEYINANRQRTELMLAMHKALEGVECLVHPTYTGLLELNLTGHPTVVVPNGFSSGRRRRRGRGGNGPNVETPTSICFTGQLFGESRLLALADAWQRSTDYHKRHPK